jgi:uncharacterized protein YcaQ
MAATRRRWRTRRHKQGTAVARQKKAALELLRERGAMTISDLGGARQGGGGWWDWSPMKTALTEMFTTGEVVCVERRGWRRVYDLPERAIPPDLLAQDPTDADCLAQLAAMAGERLGVATLSDLANFWWMPTQPVRPAIEAAGLVPVEVEGWDRPAWAHPRALEALASGIKSRHRTTLLSPFDSLIWFRERTQRIFDFHLRLEAYTPAPKRLHGYFVMPILVGGRLVGRVDPKREGRTLVVKQLSAKPRHATAIAGALAEAASWVGCDSVALERVEPAALAARLPSDLSRLGM